MNRSGTKDTQLAQVATLVPMDLVLVGKTSDASTQLTGPKLKEKKILSMKIMAIPALEVRDQLLRVRIQNPREQKRTAEQQH